MSVLCHEITSYVNFDDDEKLMSVRLICVTTDTLKYFYRSKLVFIQKFKYIYVDFITITRKK